jgi:integrase
MDLRTCGKSCLADYDGHNERFIAWATERGLTEWSLLRWEYIQDFANGLARDGKRERTIEIYTYPIRAASKKAAQNWPERFRDFATGFESPKAEGLTEQFTKSLEWVARFVLWLRDQPEGWKVLPGVALQVFLALRVEETLRLTWDRVDFGKGTILIDGELKNEFSRRILPMTALLRMILQDAPKDGERVITTYQGKDAWRNALKGAVKKDRKGRGLPGEGFHGFL